LAGTLPDDRHGQSA
jgi:hypothetical protein